MKRLLFVGLLSLTLGAQVVDQSALSFSNTVIRRMADRLAQEYYACKQVVGLWNSGTPLTSSLFPNNTTVVADGSPTDGRRALTGAMVNNIVTRCTERITDMQATSNAKLNTALAVAVNVNP